MRTMSQSHQRDLSGVLALTLIYSDDVRIRYLMAFCSVCWGLQLLIFPHYFDRPYFDLMNLLPAWFWAIAFLGHGVGAFWRIFEYHLCRIRRLQWAYAINILGLAVWLASTMAQNMNAGRLLPTTYLEFGACVMLFLTLISTGIERQ